MLSSPSSRVGNQPIKRQIFPSSAALEEGLSSSRSRKLPSQLPNFRSLDGDDASVTSMSSKKSTKNFRGGNNVTLSPLLSPPKFFRFDDTGKSFSRNGSVDGATGAILERTSPGRGRPNDVGQDIMKAIV
jgi:hypothetical protein